MKQMKSRIFGAKKKTRTDGHTLWAEFRKGVSDQVNFFLIKIQLIGLPSQINN